MATGKGDGRLTGSAPLNARTEQAPATGMALSAGAGATIASAEPASAGANEAVTAAIFANNPVASVIETKAAAKSTGADDSAAKGAAKNAVVDAARKGGGAAMGGAQAHTTTAPERPAAAHASTKPKRATPAAAAKPGRAATATPAKCKPPRKPASIAARRRKFLCKLSSTANVARAAREAGISASALYAYRARTPAFAQAWDAAINAAMDELEEALIDRAKHGVERPVYFGGKQVGTVRNYSDALGMFLLKAKRPDVYNRLKAEEGPADPSNDDARAEVMRRLERLDGDEGAP